MALRLQPGAANRNLGVEALAGSGQQKRGNERPELLSITGKTVVPTSHGGTNRSGVWRFADIPPLPPQCH